MAFTETYCQGQQNTGTDPIKILQRKYYAIF